MSYEKESLLMDKLQELMENSRLNKSQKIEIMNLVDRQERATKNQKERFCLYYGLNANNIENMTITKIANLYGCTYSAIKFSISSMRRKIVNYSNERDISIIKRIVDECEKDMKRH